jgi:pimeloyl-ACP methyl ester carboxylesterase
VTTPPSPATHAPRTVQVGGTAVAVQEYGEGQPLLIVNGTSQSLGFWAELAPAWAAGHRVITYDLRGMGGSERGTGVISVASLAQDALGLLDALEVGRAHVLGYSLGSAVAQELALAAPDRVASLVLYCTWARTDGFQRALLTGLAHPWRTGDLETALGALGVAFSPQLLDSPDFGDLIGQLLPLFPSTEQQIRTTAEQWDADLAHDTLDRLGAITAPTLVVAGEQDLLTPPWHGRQVADAIPGARHHLFTGPGSSHALGVERAEEFVPLVLSFLDEHALQEHGPGTPAKA